jgi:hypothetical protein
LIDLIEGPEFEIFGICKTVIHRQAGMMDTKDFRAIIVKSPRKAFVGRDCIKDLCIITLSISRSPYQGLA